MTKIVEDVKAINTAISGVIVVMIAQGIVVPHINLKVFHSYGMIYVSLLTFGFMMARSIASLLQAIISNAMSVRFTGLLGISLLSTCYILYKFLPVGTYPAIRMIEGFAAGIFWPLLQGLVAVGTDKAWRSRMMSIYFIIGTIAGYVGYQIGSIIYKISPRYILTSSLITLAIYSGIYMVISPGSTESKKSTWRLGIEIFKEIPRIKSYIPFMILNGGVNGLLKDYLFIYMAMVTGFPEPKIRNYWSFMGYVGLGVGFLLSCIFESKERERETLVVSSLMALSVFSVFIVKNPTMMFMALAFASAGTRTLRPILRGLVSKVTEKPEYGVALVNSISNMSAGLLPLLIGILNIIL